MMIFAIDSGSLNAAHALLLRGANVESCSVDGKTALTVAAEQQSTLVMRLLLDHQRDSGSAPTSLSDGGIKSKYAQS
eukprot:2238084-Rhodomonas_salina.2